MGRHSLVFLALVATLPAPVVWAGASPALPAAAAPALLTTDQLGDISAGQSTPIALTSQTLSAVSSGNQINAGTVQSGQVTFANGAFSGFTGIGNFVVNTGNNNVLQGSLSVTVVPLP